jgi:hypothetical protein
VIRSEKFSLRHANIIVVGKEDRTSGSSPLCGETLDGTNKKKRKSKKLCSVDGDIEEGVFTVKEGGRMSRARQLSCKRKRLTRKTT